MMYYDNGSPYTALTPDDLRTGIEQVAAQLGKRNNVLVVPPDITRMPSHAGELTRYAVECDNLSVSKVVPALGTHLPMEAHELRTMFGDIPLELFVNHHWRDGCAQAGMLSSEYIRDVSDGVVDYEVNVTLSSVLFEKPYDAILSISQVVPHEVAGMAGYTKNLIVGLGGVENIHKTHFLGAVYGMERIMGRGASPVRKVLNHAAETFLGGLPIIHVITVIGMDENNRQKVRGLFIGDDDECFEMASALSQQVNIHALEQPLDKVVVYLHPVEYKSTWLGNKSIYRTRMAIADGGELIVLAPGVKMFGEDPEIDRLIRRYGYRGTESTLAACGNNEELRNNLSAAAHLIHGSSEGRFSITYCTGGLTREEVESVGFTYAPVDEMISMYRPQECAEGNNRLENGEEFYFIGAPGSGLWAWKEKFTN
jgi:nickel-dependent lactate racemase